MSLKRMIVCFLISLAITFVIMMPSIFAVAADFLNCTEINGHYYITHFLIERCDENERYIFWKYSLILPSFIFFNLIYPLVLFSFMYRHRENLFDDKIIYKIGFLLNGYSAKTFYW